MQVRRLWLDTLVMIEGKALSVATLGGMTGVMFLPYVSINLFKYLEMGQLWIYASLSLIFLFLLYL